MDSSRIDCLKALDEYIEISERGMRSPVELPWEGGDPEYDIWMWALHALKNDLIRMYDETPLDTIENFKEEMYLYWHNYNSDFKFAYDAVDAFSRALSIC